MRKIVKFFRILIAVIVVIPVFATVGTVAIILGLLLRLVRLNKLSDAVSHGILSFVAVWIMFGLGSKVTVIGKENLPKKSENYCMFPNHNSMIDIPAIYRTGRWPGMVSKAEVWKVPLIHGLLVLLRCVKLNRKSPKDAIKAIHDGVEQISNGIPMLIFPEGTRSKDGVIGEFKSGSFKMATRAKAKVVPVVIKNTRQTLEDAQYCGIVPVYVQFLPAIDTADMGAEELKELPLRVENLVKEAYDKLPSFPRKK